MASPRQASRAKSNRTIAADQYGIAEPEQAGANKGKKRAPRNAKARRNDLRFVFGDCGQQLKRRSLRTFAARRFCVNAFAQNSQESGIFKIDANPASIPVEQAASEQMFAFFATRLLFGLTMLS